MTLPQSNLEAMAPSVPPVDGVNGLEDRPAVMSGDGLLPGLALPGDHPLRQPVTVIPGIREERSALLARLDIHTLEDLLHHAPRSHEDRRHVVDIRDLRPKEFAVVQGRVVDLGTRRYRQGRRYTYEFVVDDGTARLHCRWWNVPYIERRIRAGMGVVVWGKVSSLRPRLMDHPEFEEVEVSPAEDCPGAGEAGRQDPVDVVGGGRALPGPHVGRLVPVYPLTEGLTQRVLRQCVAWVLAHHGDAIPEPEPWLLLNPREETGVGTDSVSLTLPLENRPTRRQAFRDLHFPSTPAEAVQARERLALDELVALQAVIQRRRRNLEEKAVPVPCGGDNRLIRPFLAQLPFGLTDSQKQVLREIRKDLAGRVPMRRLLQGDVGSGKTLVAAVSALMVAESGHDTVVMAPTEVLALQLWENFRRWLIPLGVAVGLRTGDHRALDLAGTHPDGGTPVVHVGTHALLESDFQPRSLGLVIIDEQHRFGVAQRENLVRKGIYPHLLVMTATPIPRTLGLTLYGDLDVSLIHELPAGRGRVRTHLRGPDVLPRVWQFVKGRLDEGRQAYIVYPRVEADESGTVKAATEEWRKVAELLDPHAVGLLHGQLSAPDKEARLTAFREGSLRVLVTTSIIEVGLDVPNATVLVVEDAEHFGLAQLHQLRGRVGRGAEESHCILVTRRRNPSTLERLELLTRTQDGFVIAEEDLRLRGPGDLVGRAQHGTPRFRFAELPRDHALLEEARAWVRSWREGGAGEPVRPES